MDKRLQKCAELCVGDRAADIGTDHGYLPCYLVESGICSSALACDIAEKPLESARTHIARSGLEDRVTALLSDGLRSVPLEGVTDVIIAGMGGELIVSILENCPAVAQGRLRPNLVLQPMTKWDVLRRWLCENGFEVIRELPCEEGRFVYSVMQAVYTGRITRDPGLEYLYIGKVSPDTPEGREYISRQAKRLETAGRGKLNSPTEKALGEKMTALSKELSERLCRSQER
ncbi:MAG: SAM-dependent methyltransferase [Ruminococcus sp.]|nr:SAM-dependent methyltransferase [Ruminococcus sp.]